ncbi:MAG: SMC-Scp complex subunit ScpB [Tissierellia bacterium]|nr:SMC-Scp complex subunit ScpB [Tissierellia bacterium]
MEIIRKIELLLFVAREPLSTAKMASLLEVSPSLVLEGLEALRQEYEDQGKGIGIETFGNFHQLATNSRFEELVEAFIGASPNRGLGPSTLEVLSIIAYKQPITRVQIDELRGLSSDYSVRVLLDRDLIKVGGVLDTLGNPRLYVTTPRFLRNFKLDSLDDLPSIED